MRKKEPLLFALHNASHDIGRIGAYGDIVLDQGMSDLLAVAMSNDIPLTRHRRYLRGKYQHRHKGRALRSHALRRCVEPTAKSAGVSTVAVLTRELREMDPTMFDNLPLADIPEGVRQFFKAICHDAKRLVGLNYQKILNRHT